MAWVCAKASLISRNESCSPRWWGWKHRVLEVPKRSSSGADWGLLLSQARRTSTAFRKRALSPQPVTEGGGTAGKCFHQGTSGTVIEIRFMFSLNSSSQIISASNFASASDQALGLNETKK